MKKLKVKNPTVYVEGGVLLGFEGFKPHMAVDIIDYDIEEGCNICKCKAGDGPHSHFRTVTNKAGQW